MLSSCQGQAFHQVLQDAKDSDCSDQTICSQVALHCVMPDGQLEEQATASSTGGGRCK